MSALLLIIGLASLGYGLWLVSPALTYIVLGCLSLVAAYGYHKMNRG